MVESLKGKRSKLGDLRCKFVNNTSEFVKNNPWLANVPADIRDQARRDIANAVMSNKAKQKKNPKHRYELQFRSRKDKQQTLILLKKHWTRKRGQYTDCGLSYASYHVAGSRSTEPLPKQLACDSHLIRDRLGKFYLCLSELAAQNDEDEGERKTPPAKFVAIDPGVRTFLTGYDPSGQIIEFGAKDMGGLFRLGLHLDRLQGKIAANQKKTSRNRMKKAAERLRQRIHNLVDEVHKKAALYLTTNYTQILLPAFGVSGMVQHHGRKIHCKTVRQMLTWSHYRFRQRLLHKAKLASHCQVHVVTEEYTSKTCGKCGHVRPSFASKTFVCPECTFRADRDYNAGRNILLLELTKHGLSAPSIKKRNKRLRALSLGSS